MILSFKTPDMSITSPPDDDQHSTAQKKNQEAVMFCFLRSQIYLVLYTILWYNHKGELFNAPPKGKEELKVGNLQKNESNLDISPAFYDDIRT